MKILTLAHNHTPTNVLEDRYLISLPDEVTDEASTNVDYDYVQLCNLFL